MNPNNLSFAKPNLLMTWSLLTTFMKLIPIYMMLWLLVFTWQKRRMIFMSWNTPGPINLPFIGSAYVCFCRPENIVKKLYEMQASYKGFFKIWFANRLIYFVCEPHHIEKILTSSSSMEKDINYEHISEAVGYGLLTSPVSIWKRHRKVITPTFNQKILDGFVYTFVERSVTCNEIVNEQCKDGKVLDIFTIMSRYTLDSVCETLMGIKMDIQRTNSRYIYTLDRLQYLVYKKIFHVWNHIDFIWKYSANGKEWEKTKKELNDIIDKVIADKIALRETQKNETTLEVDTENEPTKRKIFLDLILENSDFTPGEIRDELGIFLFAGTDTTASTMSFFFTCLGIYPEIQQKVYEEVIEAVGYDRTITPQDLTKLKYTERVLKETLRLFPVVDFFLRNLTADLDLGDMVLPKGSSVFFGTLYIHRNPKYWPNPEKFDPDRFLPEEVSKRHTCTYIPFSYGPRNCLGLRYAMLSMKVIAATLVRRYKFKCSYKSVEDIKLKANVILRFQENPDLTAEVREPK